jgi:hypothetical protein
MQFRWVAFIALWTMLIGPILGAGPGPAASRTKPAAVAAPHLPRPR